MKRAEELIGTKVNMLTVISIDEEETKKHNNHDTYYKCRCDCGKEIVIKRGSLLRGQKSCGCKKYASGKSNRSYELIGKRFGKLIVMEKIDKSKLLENERRPGVMWLCKCDCGNDNIVATTNQLMAGRIQSCGCLVKEKTHKANTVNIAGQKFGLLTAIEEVKDKRKNGSVVWRCKCECGNEVEVSGNGLRFGHHLSCGCLVSNGERLIKKHLEDLGVSHIKQFYFEDLRSPITDWLLKFDFAVFDDNHKLLFLIEYDGEQHEYGSRFSPDPEENKMKFIKTVLYDKIKDDYCNRNGIELLRISYREKDDMTNIIDAKLKERGLI